MDAQVHGECAPVPVQQAAEQKRGARVTGQAQRQAADRVPRHHRERHSEELGSTAAI